MANAAVENGRTFRAAAAFVVVTVLSISTSPALAAPPSGEAPALDLDLDLDLDLAIDPFRGGADLDGLDESMRAFPLVARPLALRARASEGSSAAPIAPVALPFFSWGESTKDRGDPEEGLFFQGYAEQGIDWFTVGHVTFDTYAGVRWMESEKQDIVYANKVSIWLGAKLKVPFTLGDHIQGSAGAGVRSEEMKYSIDRPDDRRMLYYAEWWLGGDLQDILGIGGAGFPIRLPLTSSGLLGSARGDLEEGLLLEAYVEQAIGWKVTPRVAIDVFGGSRIFESDRDHEPWNNKASAIFGLRVECRLPFFGGPTFVAGVRGERYWHTATSDDELFRWSLFVGWGFGGDLMSLDS